MPISETQKIKIIKGLDKLISYQDKIIKEHQGKLMKLERARKTALWKMRKYQQAVEFLAEHAANPNDRQTAKRNIEEIENER